MERKNNNSVYLHEGGFKGINLTDFFDINHPSTFCFKVATDAMSGDGINIGDIVVCNRDFDAKNHDIVVVAVNGQFMIRRWIDSPIPMLKASNFAYKDLNIYEVPECVIFGVVKGIIRKIKRITSGNKQSQERKLF